MSNAAMIEREQQRERERRPRQLIRKPILGERARWALNQRMRSRRKHKILVLISAYLDAGINDPPIREMAARAQMPPLRVVAMVDSLASSGWIKVKRSTEHGQRNQYAINQRRSAG